jgi:hypothetical protein
MTDLANLVYSIYQYYILSKVPRVTYRRIEGRNWSADHRTLANVFYERTSGHWHIRIIQTRAGISLFQTGNAVVARKVESVNE